MDVNLGRDFGISYQLLILVILCEDANAFGVRSAGHGHIKLETILSQGSKSACVKSSSQCKMISVRRGVSTLLFTLSNGGAQIATPLGHESRRIVGCMITTMMGMVGASWALASRCAWITAYVKQIANCRM